LSIKKKPIYNYHIKRFSKRALIALKDWGVPQG
jgi:hypothetical protein